MSVSNFRARGRSGASATALTGRGKTSDLACRKRDPAGGPINQPACTVAQDHQAGSGRAVRRKSRPQWETREHNSDDQALYRGPDPDLSPDNGPCRYSSSFMRQNRRSILVSFFDHFVS